MTQSYDFNDVSCCSLSSDRVRGEESDWPWDDLDATLHTQQNKTAGDIPQAG